MGSWISYALSSENQNLPAYVVLRDPSGYSTMGKMLWSSGWLSPIYQGTEFNSVGSPVHHLKPSRPFPRGAQRSSLDLLARMNAEHKRRRPAESVLEARIQSCEMAARIQLTAPEVMDLSKESESTKKLYGLDAPWVGPPSKLESDPFEVPPTPGCRLETVSDRGSSGRSQLMLLRSKTVFLSLALSFIFGEALLEARAGGPKGELPDYRWVVEEQQIILRPKQLGLDKIISIYPEGLTFAANGDLLMAACGPEAGKTFIMRSSDRGKTWTRQGVFQHRNPPQAYSARSGSVEGMHMTRSGRLVLIYYVLDQKYVKTVPDNPYYVPDGNNYRFTRLRSVQWGAYSDDEGKSWRYAPMDLSLFKSMDAEASSQIFETKAGTLVASFRGHLNQEELDSGITSNGIIRSHDGGKSWGDANPIAKARPGSGLWYNESQVIPLPDGRWLCMMRLNDNNQPPKALLIMNRSYSRDQGRTWTYPVQTRFRGGEPGTGILSDGAVLCTQTAGRVFDSVIREDRVEVRRYGIEERSKLLYEISYDGGLIWAYWGDLYRAEAGSSEHIGSPIVRPLDQDTAIVVYHRGSKASAEKHGRYGKQFIGASWLVKVPLVDPRAKALRTP